MKFKISQGSKYEEIKQALLLTDDNCPCVPRYAWTEDTLCMCREFREQKTSKECHCGMWKKEIICE